MTRSQRFARALTLGEVQTGETPEGKFFASAGEFREVADTLDFALKVLCHELEQETLRRWSALHTRKQDIESQIAGYTAALMGEDPDE